MAERIESVTGVVLAGGRSSRMGADKAWLQVEGRTLIERSLDTLRQCFAQNLIIANEPCAFSSLGVPVFADEVPGLGPIGGLLTVLRRTKTPAIFLVACDMPFLDARLMRDMAGALGEDDAIVPHVGENFEPLHAGYRRRILPVVEAQIAAHALSLQALVGKLRLKILSETELNRYADWQKALLNLNTPEDIQHARSNHGQ